MKYEFSIFYYVKLLKKQRRNFLIVITVAVFLTICLSFFRPVTYVSSLKLLLGGESSYTSSSISQMLGIQNPSNSSKEVIIAILRSDRMAKDIREQFKSYEGPLWWQIDTYPIIAGLGVEVVGPDPTLTEKIANFCIENLNKINTELEITPYKPIVKVLDPATYGASKGRNTLVKIFISIILSSLAYAFYIIFADYIKRIKSA